MREIRSYGSVRGAPGNRHSYRDQGKEVPASTYERTLFEEKMLR